jgi:hypothetical protein
MAAVLHPDFQDFLKLLNSHKVDYLLIGGFAVAFHGYPRATADMDVWIAANPANAEKIVLVLKEFGFNVAGLSKEIFLLSNKIIRLGIAPIRIEIFTGIPGVIFEDCFGRKNIGIIDRVEVNVIDLKDLRKNKQASGRAKDLDDLKNLPH